MFVVLRGAKVAGEKGLSPEDHGPFLEQGFVVLVPDLKQQVKQPVDWEAVALRGRERKQTFTNTDRPARDG